MDKLVIPSIQCHLSAHDRTEYILYKSGPLLMSKSSSYTISKMNMKLFQPLGENITLLNIKDDWGIKSLMNVNKTFARRSGDSEPSLCSSVFCLSLTSVRVVLVEVSLLVSRTFFPLTALIYQQSYVIKGCSIHLTM